MRQAGRAAQLVGGAAVERRQAIAQYAGTVAHRRLQQWTAEEALAVCGEHVLAHDAACDVPEDPLGARKHRLAGERFATGRRPPSRRSATSL
jgi:hypothetical protein